MAKSPKFKPDGEPDLRGHGEGSVPTRFAPGDGRRRPGRPKGAKDAKSIILGIRDMKLEVVINGRRRRISTFEGYLLKVREKALKGDLKAIELFQRLLAQHEPPSTELDRTAELLAEDRDILQAAQLRSAVPSLIGKEEGAA